ncbi:EF-hand domain-containing protein [Sphingomonas gellani]|nr:EF-hand domain-containing protein [Sphingomonas gellani]
MLIPLLLAALSAQAQDGSPEVQVIAPGKPNGQTPATLVIEPAAMFIVACDADGDGRTSRTELDDCVRRSFAAIDTAKTGALGYIAFADWQTRWLGDQGALPSPFEVDRDGDGKITETELLAQFGKLFSRFDKDGDHAVTRPEALTVRTTAADGRGPVTGRRGGKRDSAPRTGERIPGGKPGQGPYLTNGGVR